MARNMKYIDAATPGLPVEDVNIAGLPGGSAPGNATTSTAGVVKMATAVANVAAADATSTASAETVNPTEFAAAVTLLNECKTKLNALLAAERAAGQLSN